MGEICIEYGFLEDAITYSKQACAKINDYIYHIEHAIKPSMATLEDDDKVGHVQTAISLASKKMDSLLEKHTCFENFAQNIQDVMDRVQEIDHNVSNEIERFADLYIGERKWYESAGDWIYNTFCVDIPNHLSLVRGFMDRIKWGMDRLGDYVTKIRNWFKYGDGQYVLDIGCTIVGCVVAVASTIAAFCAIPFTGGATIPIVIGCIGFIATSVGTVITFINAHTRIQMNQKALELSGDSWFDDYDGNPGAARYYGSVTKVSEYFEKVDLGDEEKNKTMEQVGKNINKIETIADTTAFVCNIANLGNVKKGTEIDISYNGDKWYRGYSLRPENVKRNLLEEMGWNAETRKFSWKAFVPNIISKDKKEKYTFEWKNHKWVVSDKTIDTFNKFKTIDNVDDVTKNYSELKDYWNTENPSFADTVDAIGNVTELVKYADFFSVADEYIYESVDTSRKVYEMIREW